MGFDSVCRKMESSGKVRQPACVSGRADFLWVGFRSRSKQGTLGSLSPSLSHVLPKFLEK